MSFFHHKLSLLSLELESGGAAVVMVVVTTVAWCNKGGYFDLFVLV